MPPVAATPYMVQHIDWTASEELLSVPSNITRPHVALELEHSNTNRSRTQGTAATPTLPCTISQPAADTCDKGRGREGDVVAGRPQLSKGTLPQSVHCVQAAMRFAVCAGAAVCSSQCPSSWTCASSSAVLACAAMYSAVLGGTS